MLPPVSRFSPWGGHGEKKQQVLAKLGAFFGRFFGLGAEPVRESKNLAGRPELSPVTQFAGLLA